MEKLKSVVSPSLQHSIGTSSFNDIPFISSTLVEELSSNPVFHQVLQNLTLPEITGCCKDGELALKWKTEGNEAFASGLFQESLACYCKALRCAKFLSEADRSIAAVIFCNRAATLHKIGLLQSAERDCARAIELNKSYAKAWYRRGCIRADLLDYNGAYKDMEMAMANETSMGGKDQVARKLSTFRKDVKSAAHPISVKEKINYEATCTEFDQDIVAEKEEVLEKEGTSVRYEKYWNADKHCGLRAKEYLHTGSLVFHEDAYAAVISKEFRDAYCHFCFCILPADSLPCQGCAIPLYCSEGCRSRAFGDHMNLEGKSNVSYHGEHKYECGGASWSAVLPSEAILASRMLVRMYVENPTTKISLENKDLWHNYTSLSSSEKLKLYLLGVTVANCLHLTSHNADLSMEPIGILTAKLIVLLSQVEANLMAIVVLSSPNRTMPAIACGPSNIVCIEQLKVAHGVFLTGSKLNHSCVPSVHASFLARRLFVRTVTNLCMGSPFELSYGPEVGESGWTKRQNWLRQNYYFSCRCDACSFRALSDFYIDGYHCRNTDCKGVILGEEFSERDAVGSRLVEPVLNLPIQEKVNRGQCTLCGSKRDVQEVSMQATTILNTVQRICEANNGNQNSEQLIVDMENNLLSLQTVLHRYNKQRAQAEDAAAKLYCELNHQKLAIKHCQTSIEILEELYGKEHIAVANERLKLASIALDMPLGNENLLIVDNIFRNYYGKNYQQHFPYIGDLCKTFF